AARRDGRRRRLGPAGLQDLLDLVIARPQVREAIAAARARYRGGEQRAVLVQLDRPARQPGFPRILGGVVVLVLELQAADVEVLEVAEVVGPGVVARGSDHRVGAAQRAAAGLGPPRLLDLAHEVDARRHPGEGERAAGPGRGRRYHAVTGIVVV